jgi:hypothetical protein
MCLTGRTGRNRKQDKGIRYADTTKTYSTAAAVGCEHSKARKTFMSRSWQSSGRSWRVHGMHGDHGKAAVAAGRSRIRTDAADDTNMLPDTPQLGLPESIATAIHGSLNLCTKTNTHNLQAAVAAAVAVKKSEPGCQCLD